MLPDPRRLLLVGTGPGGPDQVTVAAVAAMRQVDVFLVLDKGEVKADLVALREEVLARHVPDGGYRVLTVQDPPRDREAGADEAYEAAVDDWREARARLLVDAVRGGTQPGEVLGILVWGDPTLYDSTLAVVEGMRRRGLDLAVEVVPGVSSVSALVAAHGVSLNQVGRPVLVTTGRRLEEAGGFPDGVDDLVVMLDARCAFRVLAEDPRVHVWWGAYVGSREQLLVAGRLADVAEEIVRVRARAREQRGWVMDTYLLRRHRG